MKIRTKIAIGAALLAVVAIPGSATAGGNDSAKAKVKVKLEVHDVGQPNADLFDGTVKSDKGACTKKGRSVTLLRDGDFLASSELEADGTFHFEDDNPHPGGTYKAKVTSSEKCKTGVSNKVTAS